MTENKLLQIPFFHEKQIRKTHFEDDCWFSIIDIIAFFVDNEDPAIYWHKMKRKEKGIADIELSTNFRQLKLTAPDGKKYTTDCSNTEGIFRIIQSIPSPKAEPFKLWLAKIGKERIDEIENPELGFERAKSLYEKKGYPKEWIEKRLKGMAVRQKLTEEWDNRGAQKAIDYAILTNDIMQGAFSLKVDEHKKLKGLEKQNVRDHMTDLELIITMLGEATTQMTQQRDSQGLPKLRRDAKDGGAVAGRTRKDIEKQIGKKVVSEENFLPNNKKRDNKITGEL